MKLLLIFSVFRDHSVSSSAVENIQNSDLSVVESLNLTFVLICIVSFENIIGETSFMNSRAACKIPEITSI